MKKKNYKKYKIASKLRDSRGETIVEALVSLIIAVISIALLVTSITAASKINAKSQARTTDQLSFAYVDTTNSETGTADTTGSKKATINFGAGDTRNDSVTVNLYTTSNDYIYYKTH